MASDAQVVPTVVSPSRSFRHATVEHVEDHETDGCSTFSTSPTRLSSRTSISDLNEEENVEEIPLDAQLCRRTTAEISTSLWGLVKPKNFARVMPGIYRSGFPQAGNISFLKTLGLKSILTLVTEEYSPQHDRFLAEQGIHHFRIGIQANKDPYVVHSQTNMVAALSVVLDRANHPILIHCNQGKHRTGCVVGCLRKTIGWKQADMFAEYHSFAGSKARVLDELFMERFDERALLWHARMHQFIPLDEPASDSPISALTVSTRLRG